MKNTRWIDNTEENRARDKELWETLTKNISLEDLVYAIQDRGWIVTLRRKLPNEL